jgi:hypothetical protein
MVVSLLGVDEMKGSIASVEAFADERAQHAVLLVGAVEERANVEIAVDISLAELQRNVRCFHSPPPTQGVGPRSRPCRTIVATPVLIS